MQVLHGDRARAARQHRTRVRHRAPSFLRAIKQRWGGAGILPGARRGGWRITIIRTFIQKIEV